MFATRLSSWENCRWLEITWIDCFLKHCWSETETLHLSLLTWKGIFRKRSLEILKIIIFLASRENSQKGIYWNSIRCEIFYQEETLNWNDSVHEGSQEKQIQSMKLNFSKLFFSLHSPIKREFSKNYRFILLTIFFCNTSKKALLVAFIKLLIPTAASFQAAFCL